MASLPYDAYANYVIYFSTQEKVDYATSFLGVGKNIAIKPSEAAGMFDLIFPPVAGDIPPDGFIFSPPYEPGTNIKHPGDSGVILDGTLDDFFVPGQALGGGMPPSADMNLHWSATIVLSSAVLDTIPPIEPEGAYIPPRRWFMGWEGFTDMECHPNAGTGNRARDASRTVDGFGLKFRGEATTSGVVECTLSNSEGIALPARESWERLYIRLRHLGAITGDIWRCTGTAATNSGARLTLNTNGTLTGFNVNSGGANDTTFGTTEALELDKWYKIDIIVRFATVTLDGNMRVWINGYQQFSGVMGTGSTGLGQIQNHRSSVLMTFGLTSTWEIDVDDWHNADIPVGGDFLEKLKSIDWIVGTHIKSSIVLSATAPNWFNNGGANPAIIAGLNQFINPTGSGYNMQSIVALATIDAITDVFDFDDYLEQVITQMIIGPTSIAVSVNGAQVGGAINNGRLGWRIQGGAPVLSTVILPGITGFNQTKTLITDYQLLPIEVNPFSLVYEKGNSVNNTTIVSATAFTHYIGQWGLEDIPAPPVGPGDAPGFFLNGYAPLFHNCRYANTVWATIGAVPDAPVCVTSNTYIGNGTSRTIGPFLPFHILIIRNRDINGVPVIVTTTMQAPEQANATQQAVAGDVPIIFSDPTTGLAYFQVSGDGTRVNQNLANYEFFLFSDPALRYTINGNFNHGVQSSTFENLLIDGSFTPEFGMFFTGIQSPNELWLKGPKHVSFEVSTVNGTLVTTGVQFATGVLGNQATLTKQNNETAYTVFRTHDGSDLVMVQITSYTGDGTASRVIPLTPISGRFPLVAFVTRRGGAQGTIYRDTGHGGVNASSLASGAVNTTAILTFGIDSITVGITLNANLGEYDVLVFPGTSNGFGSAFRNTYCGPNGVAPGDFWDDPPTELPLNVGGIFEGGLILGGTNSLSLFKNLSGIYTLVPGKHTDTLYDRQTLQPSVEVEIPDPMFKTGYIGG